MFMSSPKVSVIVPVYNAEERLKTCIESILVQTNDDFELILVNDGSTDNSLAVCKEYASKDTRVRVIDKENSGAGETRNAGLDVATGEYIIFVDADDTIVPEMLDELLGLIKGNDDIDMVCCNHYIEFASDGSRINNERMAIEEEVRITSDRTRALYVMEQTRSFCYLWNKIFIRSIIEKNNIRFEKQFITGQDLDFVIKYYYYVKNVAVTNRPLYNYYKDGVGSLCSRYKKGLYSIVTELSRRRYELFCSLGMDGDEEYMELYAKTHIEYVHSCIPNMFRKNSNLSKKEKIEQMKVVFKDEGLSKYMAGYSPQDKLQKIFKKLYLMRSPKLAVATYSTLFFIRNNMDGVYSKLRK